MTEESKKPGHVVVDHSIVDRDWLLVITPNPDGGSPSAELCQSRSGVPGRRIRMIDLEFASSNNTFRANIRIHGDSGYTFVPLNPVNLTWLELDDHLALKSCVTIISVSPHARELCVCFKCVEIETGAMTFNVTDQDQNIFVSEDPTVAVRKKNGG